MKNNITIRTVEHKGIKVVLKVDWDKGEVSLCENAQGGYARKKWMFADRGLEYMNGWLDVLEAMKHAIEIGKKDLEQKLADDSAFKADMIINVSKTIAQLRKEGKVQEMKERKKSL